MYFHQFCKQRKYISTVSEMFCSARVNDFAVELVRKWRWADGMFIVVKVNTFPVFQ